MNISFVDLNFSQSGSERAHFSRLFVLAVVLLVLYFCFPSHCLYFVHLYFVYFPKCSSFPSSCLFLENDTKEVKQCKKPNESKRIKQKQTQTRTTTPHQKHPKKRQKKERKAYCSYLPQFLHCSCYFALWRLCGDDDDNVASKQTKAEDREVYERVDLCARWIWNTHTHTHNKKSKRCKCKLKSRWKIEKRTSSTKDRTRSMERTNKQNKQISRSLLSFLSIHRLTDFQKQNKKTLK